MNVFPLFKKIATSRSTKTAVILQDRHVSFHELLMLIERIAASLQREEIKAGDRVSIHMGNKIELIAIYYACLKTGAVFVPINLKISANEVKTLIQHSSCRLYIGDATRYDKVKKEIDECSTIEKQWIIGLNHHDETHRTHSWEKIILHSEPRHTEERLPDEVASIFYTSGTTGQPRGIVYSQNTLVNSLRLTQSTINPLASTLNNEDLAIVSLVDLISPWSILITLAAIQKGFSVLLLPEADINHFVETLKKRIPAWIAGTPSNFQAILDTVEKQDISLDLSKTVCVAGGDACRSELSQHFFSRFGSRLQSSYGQTELGGPVMYHPDLCAIREPALGWPLPSVKFKINDMQSDKGELSILTPAKTLGIWNGRNIDRFPSQRWIATGDMVRQSPGGDLFFLGRQKEQIKIEGYPVYPLEIERALMQHSDIAAAVVFSIPDTFSGERIIALVQTTTEHIPDVSDISTYLSDHIASYKQPCEYIFVEDIAIASIGKISRRNLSKRYESLTNQAIKHVSASTIS